MVDEHPADDDRRADDEKCDGAHPARHCLGDPLHEAAAARVRRPAGLPRAVAVMQVMPQRILLGWLSMLLRHNSCRHACSLVAGRAGQLRSNSPAGEVVGWCATGWPRALAPRSWHGTEV